MKNLYKKFKCWVWGHVYFADGPSATIYCVNCGKDMFDGI